MPKNDDNYGQCWRPMPPVSPRLKVTHSTDPDAKHPSAIQKDYPSLSSGMAQDKLKYQKAKKVKRKAPAHLKEGTLDDGSELTDLALDTGEALSGEEKHIASMYLDGNEEALDYWIQ